MCRGKCDGGAVRDARQAEPKMSRLKVFYIIISIGALFSKVNSVTRRIDASPPSVVVVQDDREEGEDDLLTMEMMTWMCGDMFWWAARVPPTCQDHDLFGHQLHSAPHYCSPEQ